MSKEQTIVIRGELNWAKLTGAARPYTGNPKYDKGAYWSVDVTPDEPSRKKIKAAGIADKLREPKGEKDKRTATFLTLKHLEKNSKGEKNRPIEIKDASGRPWGEDLIGNGSVGDVMVKVVDYGDTQGAYIQKVRILKHVVYEGGQDFEPLSEDDEFFGGTQVDDSEAKLASSKDNAATDDLDDDIPF